MHNYQADNNKNGRFIDNIYFMLEKKTAGSVVTVPPQIAQDNARKGMDLREKYKRGGLFFNDATKAVTNFAEIAKKILEQKDLAAADLSVMANFNTLSLNPEAKEADGGQTAQNISCLLCGGVEGISWAKQKLQQTTKTNNNSLEYKSFSFSFDNKEGKAFEEDENYFYFKGYASTFGNEDLGGDIVMPGAFSRTLKEIGMPKLCYQHDIRDPLGVFTKCMENDRGLYVEGRMPKDNTKCRDVASLIKCGAIDAMSIGYFVKEYSINEDASVRKIQDVDLHEISFVTLPMNPQAKITGFKKVTDYSQATKNTGKDLTIKDIAQISDVKEAIDCLRKVGIIAEDLKGLTRKQSEKNLRNAGFTRKAATYMVSKLRENKRQGQPALNGENIAAINKDLQELKTLLANLI